MFNRIINIFTLFSVSLVLFISSGCFGGSSASGPKLMKSNPKQLLFEYTLALQDEEFFLNPSKIKSYVKKVDAAVKNTVNLNDRARLSFLSGIAHSVLGEYSIYENKPELSESHLKTSIESFENYIKNSTEKNNQLLYLFFSAKSSRLLGKITDQPELIKKSIFKLKKEYYMIEKKKAEFGVFTLNKKAILIELADSYIALGLIDLAEDILQKINSIAQRGNPHFMEVMANLRISQRNVDEAIRALQNFNLNSYEDYFRREFNLYRLIGLYSIQVLQGKSIAGKALNKLKKGAMKKSYYSKSLIKDFHGIYLNSSDMEKYMKNLWDQYNGIQKNKHYSLKKNKKDPQIIVHLKTYLNKLKNDDYSFRENYSLNLDSKKTHMIWNEVKYKKNRIDLSLWFYLNKMSNEYALKIADTSNVMAVISSENFSLAKTFLKLNYNKLKKYIHNDKIKLSLFQSNEKKLVSTIEIAVDKKGISEE